MKKTYMKLFALAMMLVAATTASAQYTTELETDMFKAWDSPDPGANEVPADEAGTEEGPFTCADGLYQEVGGGATLYGHWNVYYLWYADLTGTQKMTFTGTPGMQLRILMNRPVPIDPGADGYDAHGGTTLERNVTIGEDGTAELDVSDLAYIHLNAIKTGWGSPDGKKLRSIMLEGSVQGSGKTHEPMELLSAGYQMDVVRVNLSNLTNLKDLMGDNDRLIFPNECASVKVNGKPATILSVEGMLGNSLFIFIDEGYSENEDDEVLVTFKNPTDPNLHLTFTDGRFEGQDVPSFTDLKAEFQDGLGEYFSYKVAIPTLVKATPENGSFNLPTSTNTFVLEFTANVDCKEVKATLAGKALSISPATGFAKVLTLTYSGPALNGDYELVVENIKPELDFLGEVGEEHLNYYFGQVVIDPNDQPMELLSASAFDNCANGGIPEGYIVNFNGEERTSAGSYGSGPRMFGTYASGGDWTHALYFREGYCETENPLELGAGKSYTISFNSAQWKDNGRWMKFEILDENEVSVVSQMIDNQPNTNGNQNSAVTGSTFTSIKFTPEADGYYRLRWTSTDANGNQGFYEVLLANVVMKYVPSTTGAEWMALVQDALDAAQKALEDNNIDRYLGDAYNSLGSLVSQYSNVMQFTSPGECQAAADALNAGIQALKDHRANCDAYDTIIKKAIDVVRQNANNKFNTTALYEQLTSTVDKYHGSSQWVNDGDEENPSWRLEYAFDVLKDDSQLQSAIAELTSIANITSLTFTEGASNPEGSGNPENTGTTHFFGLNDNGTVKSNGTGVAVLTNRLFLGAEALMRLGATEENPAIQAFLTAMTDDDAVANKLKTAIGKELEAQKATLFQEKTDEATLETYVEPVDLTLYVKNPNIYKQQANMSFNADNVPGWTVPEGFQAPGITVGWGHTGENDDVAVDCMFSNWGGAYRVEQTITDLPSGTYTIKAGFLERDGSTSEEAMADTYFYVNTTTEELTAPCTVGGQAFPFAFNGLAIENVKITDGKLTIGVNAASGTHTFFNDVRVYMYGYDGPAAGANGDVNGDGVVDVADISAIISVMAGSAVNAASADVNGDGEVDVADISKVITIMAESARRLAGLAIDEE